MFFVSELIEVRGPAMRLNGLGFCRSFLKVIPLKY